MVINVHKYSTEQEALDAIEIINDGENIPRNSRSATKNYTRPIEYNDFFYFPSDDITMQYLGQGEDVDIQSLI